MTLPPRRPLRPAAVVLAAAGCVAGCTGPAPVATPAPEPPRQPAPTGASDAADTSPDAAARPDPPRWDAPAAPRVWMPADGWGWRLALPAVDAGPGVAGPGVRVEIEPGRGSQLRLGTAPRSADDAAAAAQPKVHASEPAPGAEPRSPRHAMLAFSTPARAGDALVALAAHVGPDGLPAAGGFCLDIRGAAGPADRYAFEHPAAQLTLATAAGKPLPGGRTDDAGHDVTVWAAADRDAADADPSLIARFSDDATAADGAEDRPALQAWFRVEPQDDLLTAGLPATGGRPARRLLVVGRATESAATPFVMVYDMPAPGGPRVRAVTTRLLNRGQTRVVTVATDAAVHTLIQHLADAPHITPDVSLDGRFAAVTRTADGTLIDAYLGDGNALVLPELTLDAQSAGVRSGYVRH